MSSKKQSTEIEQTLTTAAAANLLERIAAGLRAQQLSVEGEETITLFLPDELELKLEAKGKPKKGALSLKLRWQPRLLAGPGLQIGDGVTVGASAPDSRGARDSAGDATEADADEVTELDTNAAPVKRPPGLSISSVVAAPAPAAPTAKKHTAAKKRPAAKKRTATKKKAPARKRAATKKRGA